MDGIKFFGVIFSFIVLLAIGYYFFFKGDFQNKVKHFQSSMTGLNRNITLYSNNGEIIKEWNTKVKIEDKGGTVYFIDNNGKAVIISGTFIIQEK